MGKHYTQYVSGLLVLMRASWDCTHFAAASGQQSAVRGLVTCYPLLWENFHVTLAIMRIMRHSLPYLECIVFGLLVCMAGTISEIYPIPYARNVFLPLTVGRSVCTSISMSARLQLSFMHSISDQSLQTSSSKLLVSRLTLTPTVESAEEAKSGKVGIPP